MKKSSIWVFTLKDWRGSVVVDEMEECETIENAVELAAKYYLQFKTAVPEGFKGVKVMKEKKSGLETQLWIEENLEYGVHSYSANLLKEFENYLK